MEVEDEVLLIVTQIQIQSTNMQLMYQNPSFVKNTPGHAEPL